MKIKYTTLQILLIIAIGITISSCNKDYNEITIEYDCTFVQDDSTTDGHIDETERNIMTACSDSRYTDVEDIRSNLIGEWQLIGHGEGWIAAISQPCAYLTITEDEIVFDYQDNNLDLLTTHTWTIQTVDINSLPPSTFHRFTTTPTLDVWLGLNIFCNNYMYGDSTPSDGNMYLFEKMK